MLSVLVLFCGTLVTKTDLANVISDESGSTDQARSDEISLPYLALQQRHRNYAGAYDI